MMLATRGAHSSARAHRAAFALNRRTVPVIAPASMVVHTSVVVVPTVPRAVIVGATMAVPELLIPATGQDVAAAEDSLLAES